MWYRASRQGAGGGVDASPQPFLRFYAYGGSTWNGRRPLFRVSGGLFGSMGFPSQSNGTRVTHSKERSASLDTRVSRIGADSAEQPRRSPLSSIIDSSRSSTNLRRIGDVPFPPSLAQPHPVLRFSRSDSTPLS